MMTTFPSTTVPSKTIDRVEQAAPKGKSRSTARQDEYRAFCRAEASELPLFSRDWWLDATVGPQGWDVAIVEKGKQIVATMPYVLRSRYGMQVCTQPPLTPFLGPWLRRLEGRTSRRLSSEAELMQSLIDQLPPFDHFSQTWHPTLVNWQPFYWNGFQQSTYYNYILPDLTDIERLWADLDNKVRRNVAKAQRFELQVRDDVRLEDFLELNHKTFRRQDMATPYSDDFVRRIDAACVERACRKILVAVDRHGTPVSGEYCVWDEHSAYNLFSGTDPDHRQSGANSLCLWSTIRFAATVTRRYNFCGSMIKPIETYMRAFGAEHVPYFHIKKTPSRLLNIRQCLSSLIGGA